MDVGDGRLRGAFDSIRWYLLQTASNVHWTRTVEGASNHLAKERATWRDAGQAIHKTARATAYDEARHATLAILYHRRIGRLTRKDVMAKT